MMMVIIIIIVIIMSIICEENSHYDDNEYDIYIFLCRTILSTLSLRLDSDDANIHSS